MRIYTLAFLICAFVQTFGQSFILRPNNTTTNRLSLRSIELTNSGDYVCVGGYRATIGSSESGFIALVSPGSNTVIWARLFEPGSLMWSVAKTANDEFVASGQIIGNHSFICRFNTAGTVLWRTELSAGTEARCVAESPNGNIWTGGTIFGPEFLACLDAAGTLQWAKVPPGAIGSLITHMMQDGADMDVFGSETYLGEQQASVRKFDEFGNELLHTVVGNNSGAAETLYDVALLPSGGYALAMQYVYPIAPFAGRQEIGIIRLNGALGYIPALTRAYIEVSNLSLVSPRVAADATSLYFFCTKNSALNGGTVAAKLSLATGVVQTTDAIARGSSRVGRILWNTGNLTMASVQDLLSNMASPPEVQADFACLNPATLQRTTVPCESQQDPPDIIETSYYGTVSATSIPSIVWGGPPFTSGPGPMPEPLTLSYSDCMLTLPIELTSFTARAVEGAVELRWVTATEHDNDYFEIERSIDGWSDWEVIVSVEGVGNSQVQTVYAPVYDQEPLPGTSYYRLHQVDTNGDDSYSNVESVHFDPPVLGPLEYHDLFGRIVTSNQLATGMYIVHRAGSVLPGRKIWIEKTE